MYKELLESVVNKINETAVNKASYLEFETGRMPHAYPSEDPVIIHFQCILTVPDSHRAYREGKENLFEESEKEHFREQFLHNILVKLLLIPKSESEFEDDKKAGIVYI